MARIFKLPPVADTELVLDSHGFVLDSPDTAKAYFAPVPIAGAIILRQPAPVGMGFPAGSIGAWIEIGGSFGINQGLRVTSFEHGLADAIEQGSIIANVILTWTLGFPVAEVTGYVLEGPGTPIDIPVGSYSVELLDVNVGTTSTWTLHCSTAFGEVQASCELSFGFKVYNGRGGSSALTETQIEALVSNFLVAEQPSEYVFAANAAGVGSEYLWLAWPEEFGVAPVFLDTDTSLKVPFTDMGLVSVTNSMAVMRNYQLTRSTHGLNGAITVVAS